MQIAGHFKAYLLQRSFAYKGRRFCGELEAKQKIFKSCVVSKIILFYSSSVTKQQVIQQ